MILLLISFAGSAAVFLLYRHRKARALLRLIPFLLLAALVGQVSISFKTRAAGRPVAVLVDVSKSFAGQYPGVAGQLKKIAFPADLIFFAESIYRRVPGTDSFGNCTDITNALRSARNRGPRAIMLITDGNHNGGESPVELTRSLAVPVHVFADTARVVSNVAVRRVEWPPVAFFEDSLPIQVAVASVGFSGGTGEVVLSIPARGTDLKKPFPLSGSYAENSVNFTIPGRDLEGNSATIRIAPQPNENDYRDNRVQFRPHIYRRKKTVAYISHHLSFNSRFILTALKALDNIDLTAIGTAVPAHYRSLLDGRDCGALPDLNKFDIIALDNIRLDPDLSAQIVELAARGKGILVLGSVENVDDVFNRLLPITIAGRHTRGPFILTIATRFSVLEPDKEFPPATSLNRVLGAKTDAVIIARTGPVPVIGYRRFGAGAVFQINIIDLGAWQFLPTRMPVRNFFTVLLDDVVTFLSPYGRENRLVLNLSSSGIALGQELIARLQCYNKNYERSIAGDFHLVVGGEKIPFYRTEAGDYEASFVPRCAGEFELYAAGQLGEESLRSDSVRLAVFGRQLETEQGPNQDLLSMIAKNTGGRVHRLDQIAGFNLPQENPREVTRTLRFDHAPVYFLIFALIGVDWVLRRRQGRI